MIGDQARPAYRYQVAHAFWRSRMVAVAAELDLFAGLPATLEEMCARLGLHPRPTEALLNSLCAMGVLEHDKAWYQPGTAPVDTWLDQVRPPGGPNSWHYPLWMRLRALLETGEPQAFHAGLDFCPDEVALRRFVEAGEARAAGCGPELAGVIDWKDASTVVDLGGARGSVLSGVLRAHPHLHGTCFDLPAVRPLFDEQVADLGARLRFRGGDFFSDELPEADVYVLGHLLSDWDDDRCAHLVERAAAALAPHGTLLLYDTLIDPDRPHTAENWLYGLNAQLLGPSGTVNSADDCRTWYAAAGLTGTEVRSFGDTESLVIGTRPAQPRAGRTALEER